MKSQTRRFAIFLILFGGIVSGQTSSQKLPAAKTSKGPSANAATKSVKPDSVSINLPEGMTKEQADAILTELRQIRQLLEKQTTAAAALQPAVPPPPTEKVNMSVGKGWSAMGREDAPVTMVEFADYQCPFCRRFHTDTFAELKKNYIDTGKLRFISLDLPLDFHANAMTAAMAARCAGDQNKFWELRDSLIVNSTDLSKDSIAKYAKQAGIEMSGFSACLDAQKYKNQIETDREAAGKLGFSGTPSFAIGKTKENRLEGVKIVGAVPYAVFDSKIRELLASP